MHRSIQEAGQTVQAYGLLLRDLPNLLRRAAQRQEGKMSKMQEKRKILFLTNYPRILAAPRMRVFSYLPLMERMGFECKVITVIPEFVYSFAVHTGPFRNAILYPYQFIMRVVKALYAIAIASRYDAIFIRGVYFPLRLERVLARVNTHIIFDLVDAVYLRKELSTNLVDRIKATFYDQSVLLPRMLSVARAVNLRTPYLQEYVRKYCQNTWVTLGPMQSSKCKTYLPKKPHEVVIGWMGSPSTVRYLCDLTEILSELQRKYNVKIKIIGAGQAYQPPKTLRVIKEDWHLETEIEQLYSFDIGIMPLSDGPWERCKGGFKLLQYMSVGVSSVASPVGINKQLIQDGVNGFLASSRNEWIEKLSLLVEDSALRKELGIRGWETAQQYTVEAQAYHKGGGISEQIKATRLFYSLCSRILYGYKHFTWWAATGLAVGTLFLEPLTRLVWATVRCSLKEIVDTVKGYLMLWKESPRLMKLAWGQMRHGHSTFKSL